MLASHKPGAPKGVAKATGGGSAEGKTGNEITSKMISSRFKDYILNEKPGLQRFYKSSTRKGLNQYLKEPTTRALSMTQQIMDKGCPWETAFSLSLIALYDLVMLLDNSLSMKFGEKGKRIKTLNDTLRIVSAVYSLAAEGKGINAVRLLNSPYSYTNVGPGKINDLKKQLVFEGLTNIGTKLRDKVLVHHAGEDMKRPLLVIVITDGEVEGEVTGLLRDVIMSKAVELKEVHGEYGPQGLLSQPSLPDWLSRQWRGALIAEAIAYQFARIGNLEKARELFQNLDDDEILVEIQDQLEGVAARKWEILPKLLLGAISKHWDAEGIAQGYLESRDSQLAPRVTAETKDELVDDGDDGFGAEKEDESSSEDGEVHVLGLGRAL